MNSKVMKQSLRKQITVIQIALMVVLALILIVVSYQAFRKAYLQFYFEKSLNIVEIVADETDWELIEPYVETGVEDDYVRALRSYYNTVKAHFSGVDFLYLFVPFEDLTGQTYIIDAQTPEDDPERISAYGDTYEWGETELAHLKQDILAGRASSEIVLGTASGYSTGLYVWAPVFDKDGNVRAMVEADTTLNLIQGEMNAFVMPVMLVFLLGMAAVLGLMLTFMRRSVTEPLGQLTEFVNSYDHGKIDEDLFRFRHDDEIRYLAESFREMTFRIDKYIHDLTAVTAEKERIGAELNVATQIQADMLPRIFPAFPDRTEFDLYATMDPAKEVGGDFYDYFFIDRDHLALVMADVSGKGVPAALFMVISKTLLKNRAQSGGSPKEILADVNNQLCEGNEAELFVTVWLGILTVSTGHLISASAGHEYPAIYREGRGFALEKDKHGPPLATMEGLRYRETEYDLHPGDALFMYTDGVTEATNAASQLFGEERMLLSLNQYGRSTPEEIIAGVRRDIDAFVAEAPQFDDITMLCLRYQ